MQKTSGNIWRIEQLVSRLQSKGSSETKFISPAPPLTPRQAEAAYCLIEECAEVQIEILRCIAPIEQRATKLLRFGNDIQAGQPDTNKTRLSCEVGDLLEVIELGVQSGILDAAHIAQARVEKRAKLAKYLQTDEDA